MASVIPAEAITLIQTFEGCHERHQDDGLIHAYPDPGSGDEPHTIGWGTTRYPDGRKVRLGDAISQQEADRCLLACLERDVWLPLSRSIPGWSEMTDPMRAALCSFAYNIGPAFYGASRCATITQALRQRCWPEVPAALQLYVNPGSPVEAGLRRRRQAEAELWSRGLAELSSPQTAPAEEILEAITDTFLKKERLDSAQLRPDQLIAVERGRQWKISRRLELSGRSQRVRLAYGAGDWWLYQPHWRSRGAAAEEPAGDQPLAGAVRDLAVPHLSQLDNRCNPLGSCNVTCVAMCLSYLGLPRPKDLQLEDALYQRLEAEGRNRHDPYALQALIDSHPGYRDLFRCNGGFADIRRSIDAGHPVIVHGYFTPSGHIVVIRGYDAAGFLVNDPYGEWTAAGYDTSRSGERLHYSQALIARVCSPESQADPRNIWLHSVFRL